MTLVVVVTSTFDRLIDLVVVGCDHQSSIIIYQTDALMGDGDESSIHNQGATGIPVSADGA